MILKQLHHFHSFDDALQEIEYRIQSNSPKSRIPRWTIGAAVEEIVAAYKKSGICLPFSFRFLSPSTSKNSDIGLSTAEEVISRNAEVAQPGEHASMTKTSRWNLIAALDLSSQSDQIVKQIELSAAQEYGPILENFPVDRALTFVGQHWGNNKNLLDALNLKIGRSWGDDHITYELALPGGSSLSDLFFRVSQKFNISVLGSSDPRYTPDVFIKSKDTSGNTMGTLTVVPLDFMRPWGDTTKDLAQGVTGAILAVQQRNKQYSPLQGIVCRSSAESNQAQDGTRWLSASLDLLILKAVAIAANRSQTAIKELTASGRNSATSFRCHYEALHHQISSVSSPYDLPMLIEAWRSNAEECLYFDIYSRNVRREANAVRARIILPVPADCSYWLSLQNNRCLPLLQLKPEIQQQCLQHIKDELADKFKLLTKCEEIFTQADELAKKNVPSLYVIAKILEIPSVLDIVREHSDIFLTLEALSTIGLKSRIE